MESCNKEKQIQELLIENTLLPTVKKALQSQRLSDDFGWCCNTPLQTGRLRELEHEQVGVWVFVSFGFFLFFFLKLSLGKHKNEYDP